MTKIDCLRPLHDLDWANLNAVHTATSDALTSIASSPDVLRDLLSGVARDDRLFGLCEHYDILDKIVLASDESAPFRLRLHLFLPGYFDRPHNHRWTYSSLVLSGRYKHFLYGDTDDLVEGMDVSALAPQMIRYEVAGSSYTLSHRVVHSVTADPYTVSLIIRGPAVKDRFLVMDKLTGSSWWQYGASSESRDEQLAKRMTEERLESATQKVLELIAPT